jgi:hypothetical protein
MRTQIWTARATLVKEGSPTLGCSESFLSKVENDKVRPSLLPEFWPFHGQDSVGQRSATF